MTGQDEQLKQDIARYSQLFGPSGEEDEVIRAFLEDVRTTGVETHVDKLGNVIATLCNAQSGFPTVMISAHLDEIGFVVRKIEANGYLRIHRVGGVHDLVIAGQTLLFRTDTGMVEGVVGVKAKHVSSAEELRSAVTVDEAYVDIFARSDKEVLDLGLEVGTLGTFKGPFSARDGLIRGKAFDDRIGIGVLLELARRVRQDQPAAGVVLVATVQEEFSVRGGVTAAQAVRPDFALCLDIAVATDTPDLGTHGAVALGAGPVITRFTRALLNGIIPNPKLRRFVAETAASLKIPIQNAVLQGGLTDGSFMQYEGDGIPILDLSFPTRYTHTAVETCNLRDVIQLADLVEGAVRAIPKGFDLRRG